MKIPPPGFEIKPPVLQLDIDTDTGINTYRFPIIAAHFFGIVAPATKPEPKPAEMAA